MAAHQQTKPKSTTAATGKGPTESADVGVGKSTWAAKEFGLKLLVFVAGAVLMGLEIVGSRILAPYFGNSVFVWGSLISLFLIALSAGYYVGGRVADRRPSRVLLNSIVAAVAASMFAMAVIADPVCDAIFRQDFGEKWGPFLASVVLFLLPSIGMGMVSPFAVRLATHTVASVGKTAGTLYALSTLGSIAGTMLTTFVLIPAFGASTILLGLAGALLAIAVVTFPLRQFGRQGAIVAPILWTLAAMALVFVAPLAMVNAFVGDPSTALSAQGDDLKLIREVNTPYHRITVGDDLTKGVRQLKFDRFVESAIEIAPPHRSASPYTLYFHLALAVKPDVRTALFIGAGGGVGPRAFHMHNPEMQIDVVDIDEKVLEIARTDFFMEDVPQIRPHAVDGRTFVRNAPDGHYDAIILDAFTIGGRIPFHLVTREFFALCKDKLAPGGVFLMNTNSALRGPKAQIFQSMFKTIDAVNPNTQAFFFGSEFISPTESSNVILVATNGGNDLSREEWAQRAAAYESASYVAREQVERMVEDLVTTLPQMDDAPIFTDDYAPIETMTF